VGAGGKGKNKRTADVLSLFSEKEMSAGGTIRLKPPVGGKEGSRKKPRTAGQGHWKERAEELEKQGECMGRYGYTIRAFVWESTDTQECLHSCMPELIHTHRIADTFW